MKKIITTVFIAAVLSTATSTTRAQVSVNVNIGVQPEWGPVGYDYAEYYYLPDIEVYYFVPRRQFVYFHGNRWVFSSRLPPVYAHYDLYGGYKVVVNTPHAYRYHNSHKIKYSKYKGYKSKQGIIKHKHKGGNHKGHYKNKDKGKKYG